MKIVADENIPLVQHYFGGYGDLILKPGRTISHADVLDADILLTRSVTPVTQELLQKTSVKFVGSTTIGYDHIDTEWLNANGIQWAIAKNCNAKAVVDYVVSVLAALQNRGLLTQPHLRAGVVGVGAIGEQVATLLEYLGFEVLRCDPLRADKDPHFHSTPLAQLADVDFITLHAPFTKTGDHPTYHLIEKNLLQNLKPGCVLLNTSRGSVINFVELKQYGKQLHWCLDVWENEPNIDLEVLAQALIATPHIAGYSIQSKYRGIDMIYRAAVAQQVIKDKGITQPAFPRKEIYIGKNILRWQEVIETVWDISQETYAMQTSLEQQIHTFDELRNGFANRMEFDFIKLLDLPLADVDRETLKLVGFK